MERKRYTDEQIAYALRQAEAGTPIKEVCRKLGVSEQTFYTWRRKFAGMGVAELWELLPVQQLVSELAVEALHIAVLPWGARLDKQRADAEPAQPVANRLGGEFRSVI